MAHKTNVNVARKFCDNAAAYSARLRNLLRLTKCLKDQASHKAANSTSPHARAPENGWGQIAGLQRSKTRLAYFFRMAEIGAKATCSALPSTAHSIKAVIVSG